MTHGRTAGSATRASGASAGWLALHVLALWALAVTQPLYDTVARNAEFLVAHRASGLDLILLVVLTGVVAPGVLIAGAMGAGLVSPRARHAALTLFVGLLVTLLSLQALGRLGAQPWTLVALAALIGAGFATLHARLAVVRTFTTFLTPAIVVVPGLFLLADSVGRVRAGEEADVLTAPDEAPTTPVVVVVFDQFPLVSLLDEAEQIDARLFPALARLAGQSVWFRNATSVAGRTDRALPSILTGRYPRAGQLPRSSDHPHNLFTWLGATHDLHVVEPITFLCPSALCDRSVGSAARRVGAMARDLGAVYPHVVTPPEWADALPRIDQDWRNFDLPLWQRRWIGARDEDRRARFLSTVDAIQADADRPSLHFIHVLLPHEPFIYYPSGRRFASWSAGMMGLAPGERWTSDPWPVALSYQRHLAQVRMVDGLVGRLVDRLTEVGLFDRALLVVAADHGASFRPGLTYKAATRDNFGDVMSVPLLVKLPGVTEGRVDTSSVETIDVLPTIADALGQTLPWEVDGQSALRELRRTRQRIYVHTGRDRMDFASVDVQVSRRDGLRGKLDWFGSPVDPSRITGLGAFWDLVGRPVSSVEAVAESGVDIDLERPSQATPDWDGRVLPGLVRGTTIADVRRDGRPVVAVAVNGIVRAIARTHYSTRTDRGTWSALLPEDAFAAGDNDVRIYEVQERGAGTLVLRDARAEFRQAGLMNLLDERVVRGLGVEASGFYATERQGGSPFRWTAGHATLVVPIEPGQAPEALAIGLVQGGRPGRRLTVAVDGCEVLRTETPASPTRTIVSLEGCAPSRSPVTIAIDVEPFVPGPHDRRELGAAISLIAFSETRGFSGTR